MRAPTWASARYVHYACAHHGVLVILCALFCSAFRLHQLTCPPDARRSNRKTSHALPGSRGERSLQTGLLLRRCSHQRDSCMHTRVCVLTAILCEICCWNKEGILCTTPDTHMCGCQSIHAWIFTLDGIIHCVRTIGSSTWSVCMCSIQAVSCLFM